MELIKTTAVQALNSLENLLPSEQKRNEVSLYGEGKVSASAFALNIVKLKRAFPKLPDGWYTILEEMLDEEKFTDQRLTDAVNHLIKTSIYPEPTIANLLTFDKKTKLWNYEEALEYSKDFSTERRRKFWDGLEYNKSINAWREKR